MLEHLKKSLLDSVIVKIGDYDYFITPITDGIPVMEPDILVEISKIIKENFNLDVDKIVAVEAMGIPLATALSIETGIPSLIIRKRQYNLPDEVSVDKKTGYGNSTLYINGLNEGDRILLIDDVVSTGGTLISLINALKEIGVNIITCVAVLEKGEGKTIVENETGCKIDSIIKLHVDGGKVVIDSVIGE
ncbi:hypoxanthine/guanine phosphoribosyltransferase [uncultured Methanobrevibacter sp.]|uniref:hypoxanthine/guanine phosphoribosyltransferase n=1 Tax=uncultured Methanobrevibacter sp. TaxID=253161 RepID=UPI0025FD7787|nr:hypoxanthine/guanine phosphoribosyltransferase [uncultured Methanobrevibacter sp.]